MIKYRVENGRKKEGDQVLIVNATDHKITMPDLACMAQFLYVNENLLYPPPNRGGEMLVDYIVDSMRAKDLAHLKRLAEEYKLGGRL